MISKEAFLVMNAERLFQDLHIPVLASEGKIWANIGSRWEMKQTGAQYAIKVYGNMTNELV